MCSDIVDDQSGMDRKIAQEVCKDGTSEEDHQWEYHQDDQGDEIYTMTYSWMECSVCGKTKEDDGGGYDDVYD